MPPPEDVMSDPRKDIYDFSKLEDMFDAIDTLTRATAVLASVDQQLASDLVKMTNTLIEMSQDGTQKAGPVQATEIEPVEENVDLDDLTVVTRREQKSRAVPDDDVIIDVLTGEPISK